MPLYVLGPKHPQEEILSTLEKEFVLVREGEVKGRHTFFDTFDWRLFNAGFTLKAVNRRGRGFFLTLTGGDSAPREAWVDEAPSFGDKLPPGSAWDRISEVSGIRRLLPRAICRWQAESAAILNEDEKTVARIRIRTGDAREHSSGAFQSVPPTLEIIPLKGYEKEAHKVRSFLRRAFGMRPCRGGELELSLGSLGRKPGVDPSDPGVILDPAMEAAEATRTIHRALFTVMVSNEEGLLQDLDSEFLHDFRVAVRRTRSALGRVKGIFPIPALKHFQNEFRWLGSRTGPTRDMDVYLLKIPQYQAALPSEIKNELEPLVSFLERKKQNVQRSLVRTFKSRRYAALKEDWSQFLAEPPPMENALPNSERPILAVASERIWKLYRLVLKDGKAAGKDSPAEALHQLRIDCKKLRYMLSLFQTLFPPKELRPVLKELKNLQETLGNFNDLHVQRESLGMFAEEMLDTGVGPPNTLMAMGRLMGQLEAQQEVERGSFHERFTRFARSRNVTRFEKLFKPRQTKSTKTK